MARRGISTVHLHGASQTGIRPGTDFHTLSSSQVTDLLLAADLFKYRKPKNANGSRGRYFHAYLQRLCR